MIELGCGVGRLHRVAPMILPRFELARPASLAEACALLREGGGEVALLAGGTDLLVKLKRQERRPRLVVSLARVEELRRRERAAGGLVLGALATMSELAGDPLLAGPHAALAEGAGAVGGPLIRNRATVGGNLVSARPCADTAPPLLVLGARLELVSSRGVRSEELDGFILAPGVTRIAPDEVLSAIRVPAGEGRAGSAYLKATRRAAMEVTTAGVAASLLLDAAGKIARARIALASVGPVPLRAPAAEALLVGEAPEPARFARAAELARDAASPIDDHRATAAYRREAVEVLCRRALAAALARAQGRGA